MMSFVRLDNETMRIFILLLCVPVLISAKEPPLIQVAKEGKGFIEKGTEKTFTPWGFNYDRDSKGNLIEDYWSDEWKRIEEDFAEMKKLGGNVVRVHLQFGKFMEAADKPNPKSLEQLARLVKLAETVGLYLDVTGLGCYHKKDVPAWYDKLDEKDRWEAQSQFWKAVAKGCQKSNAIFCYNLMNEPVVSGGKRKEGEWLGGEFGGKHYVQFITLDQGKRERHEIARAWVSHLVKAIRSEDPSHLITVGLVDWSLDKPGLSSGFIPDKVCKDLDFVSVHLYPESKKLDENLKTLEGFQIGKPVVIEETFPLKCTEKEFADFIERSKKHAHGWVGFYWGTPPNELRKSKNIGDHLLLGLLEYFEKHNPNKK